jgi:hypothetical protein
VYAGGAFTSIAGVARNRIAKITGGATADPNWNPNANNAVNSLTLDGAGSVFPTGTFTVIGGRTRIHISKLSTSGTEPPTEPGTCLPTTR